MFSQRVDQVGRRHALGHAVLPAARLDKIIEEQRDDVVRLDERSVAIHNAEAVRIAVGGNRERRAHLFHLRFGVAQQLVGGLRRMAAEEHVAEIVHCLDRHACLAQQVRRIAAPRAPERIVDHLDARFGDSLEIHQIGQPLQERGLHVGGLESLARGLGMAARQRPAIFSTAASICLVASGSAGAPSGVEYLMPLYSGGLCEAVKLMAPEVLSVRTA